MVPDPIRGAPHLMIMTEVLSPNGEPHPTNTRSPLAALIDDKVTAEAPLFGFEQEYTMLAKGSNSVLGWPEGGYPAPQVRNTLETASFTSWEVLGRLWALVVWRMVYHTSHGSNSCIG